MNINIMFKFAGARISSCPHTFLNPPTPLWMAGAREKLGILLSFKLVLTTLLLRGVINLKM